MNYAYEWTVTDSFSNTHIIKLKKEEVNRYIFFAGGPGGTILSYKGRFGKFRIDWDPKHGFHTHPPGHI